MKRSLDRSPKEVLTEALDDWVFGNTDLVTRSGVSFLDDDKVVLRPMLMKFDISSARQLDSDHTEFAVILTFQSKAHTELKQSKTYLVYQHKSKWKILQTGEYRAIGECIDLFNREAEATYAEVVKRDAEKIRNAGDLADFFRNQSEVVGLLEKERKFSSLVKNKRKEVEALRDKADDPDVQERLQGFLVILTARERG